MTAYFQETGSQGVIELPISAGQTSYQVTLPPGTYIAYAWVIDFSLGGLYSEAVPCGLRATCSDHKPISFTVDGINYVEGIDLCDWYAFGVPEPPGKPALDIKGAISGQIIHPDGSPPELRVVAFNQTSGYWYWVKTISGQVDYSIPSLPPGVYHLVAYPDVGQAGGHADAGHKLLDVQVKAGETAAGVSIADWNAPSGAFPPDPTR